VAAAPGVPPATAGHQSPDDPSRESPAAFGPAPVAEARHDHPSAHAGFCWSDLGMSSPSRGWFPPTSPEDHHRLGGGPLGPTGPRPGRAV